MSVSGPVRTKSSLLCYSNALLLSIRLITHRRLHFGCILHNPAKHYVPLLLTQFSIWLLFFPISFCILAPCEGELAENDLSDSR